MPQKLNEFSLSCLIPAIEESLREYWGNYGRTPQSELYDGPELLRLYMGVPSPFLNGVCCRRIPNHRVNTVVEETLAYFHTRNVPWEWIVGSKPVPTSLPQSLIEQGLFVRGELNGMAIHLDRMKQTLSSIERLEIKPVEDDEMLKIWAATAIEGFELPVLNPIFVNLESSLGVQQPFYRRYLAFLSHQPVATSAVFLGENVAGIYCVSTVPAARRMGIGAAVTLRALQEAQARGYHIAVLHATQMGSRVYRQLGFQDISVLRGYSPEK